MSWLNRLGSTLRSKHLERDLDEELRFHLEMRTRELMASGMSPEEARREAGRRFGNRALLKESARERDTLAWLESILQDLRYGLRMLVRSPGFTAVAALSLALGIGGNTAIFSLIDTLLLRLLPVERPEELVHLTIPASRGGSFGFSYPLYEALRDHNQTLAGIFAVGTGAMNVSVDGQAEIAYGGGQFVSGSYYATLGARAIVGRTFTEEEDRVPGQNPVAVISYAYWKRRFALDPSIVGKAVQLNGVSFAIIGVTPRNFYGIAVDRSPDVTVPMAMYPALNVGSTQLSNRDSWWLRVMGRLKPGVTATQAAADLNVSFQQYLAETGGQTQRSFADKRIALGPGGHGIAINDPAIRAALFGLMAAVTLVLMIACANVANLLLARSAARQKEIAMRLSLGAGRPRIMRQLLTESVLLALLGGALGVLFAYWGDQGLLELLGRGPAPIPIELKTDARILAFTAAVCVLTGLLFGLAPAVTASRLDLTSSMKVTATAGSRARLSRFLVGAQVALSLVLLIGTGLFGRSLQNLKAVDLGFQPQRVLVISVDPTLIGYRDERMAALAKQLLEKVESTPGVLSASLASYGLVSGGHWENAISVPGYLPRPRENMWANFSPVGPRFFETVGMPLRLGRGFTAKDNETAPKVVVVSERLVRQYFTDGNPLGRTMGLGPKDNLGQFEIVGVAKDAKYGDLHEKPQAVVYVPFWQLPPRLMRQIKLDVRTAADPAAMIATIRRQILAVEPNMPIYSARSLAAHVEDSLFVWDVIAEMAGLFSVLALLLASVGLYGVISYMVVRRTAEIGIRMALGAARSDVVWLVIRQALVPVLGGVAGGLAAALGLTRFLATLLFGVTPIDPLTIGAATLGLLGVAAFTAWLPARRASRMDPTVALRQE